MQKVKIRDNVFPATADFKCGHRIRVGKKRQEAVCAVINATYSQTGNANGEGERPFPLERLGGSPLFVSSFSHPYYTSRHDSYHHICDRQQFDLIRMEA